MQDFFLHYCLVKELATKTSRITYLAYPSGETQNKVLLKIFDKECANQDHKMNSAGLNTLMSMDHPSIVPMLDIGVEQGKPYIVSEYRALGSVGRRLGHLKRGSHKHMDWPDAVRIVQQIGQALSYAHSHEILHGNIKPENIFYYDNGVQLTDFSLSPFIDVTKLGYKSDLHTTRYMAPEQFVGKTEKASDQYALACVAHELITGHVPFDAQSFSSMWGMHVHDYATPLSSYVNVPMPIDAAILRALAKKSEDRYEDMDAFLRALENALSASKPEEPSDSNSSLAALLSNAPAGVKKAPVTKPFGFTPFPEAVERTHLARSREAPEKVVMPELDALLAIDPPSLSALKHIVAGRKSAPQPESHIAVTDSKVSAIPIGEEAEQATNPLPGVREEAEQATNPLLGFGDGAHIRPYDQLIPETDEEGDLLFSSMLAETDEEPVAEKVLAFQSAHSATDQLHSSAIVSPPQKTQRAFTRPRLPGWGWKLSIALLGVVLLLTTIVSLLLYSFNGGMITLEKHAPVTTVATILPTPGVTRNVQPTATPLPTARPTRPTVRPTRVSQHSAPPPVPTSSSASTSLPVATPTPVPTQAVAVAATVYSFEDGTLDQWQVSDCSFANSTTMARTGGHSLVITQPNVNTGESDKNPYLYMDGGNVSLLKAGQTIDAYIYVPSGSVSIQADISVSDAKNQWSGSGEFVLSPGSWNHISYTAQSFSAPMGEIGINLYYVTSGGGTVQPVYIDDISW